MLLFPALAAGAAPGDEEERRGDASATASIVRGAPTTTAAFPWAAHIVHNGDIEDYECTGTVVGPRLVLTAAHCLITGTGRVATAANFRVTTGAADLAAAPPAVAVTRALVFPEYRPAHVQNDIGLLVLASPVAAPAIALATPADADLTAPGTPLAAAGWGLVSFRAKRAPTVLRTTTTVIQRTATCRQQLRSALGEFSPATQICVKSPAGTATSLCDGDSGGPGIATRADGTPVQVGVISLKGSPTCGPGTPQVLARVANAASWVAAWRAAIEGGAPAPPVVDPPVRLPSVTRDDASEFGALYFSVVFGRDFTRGTGHSLACARVDRTKLKCRAAWLRRGLYFRGAFTVFSALPREGSIYQIRYRIRRFSARCWIRHLNPKRHCRYRLYAN